MDGSAFIAAIRSAPSDPTVSLVYADWLEDRGDRRSELLRVWCELNQVSHAAERFRPLLRSYRELWSATDPGWVLELGDIRPWVSQRLAEELVRGYLRYVEGRGGDRRGVIEGETQWFEEGWLVSYWMKAFHRYGRRHQQQWCLFVDKDRGSVFGVWSAGPKLFMERYKAGFDWKPAF